MIKLGLFEDSNRNLIISFIIVIFTGFISPVITYGLNLGIILQIPEYVTIWVACTVIPAIFAHYARTRRQFQFRKSSILNGYCFIPIIISNIIVPILGRFKS